METAVLKNWSRILLRVCSGFAQENQFKGQIFYGLVIYGLAVSNLFSCSFQSFQYTSVNQKSGTNMIIIEYIK